MQLDLFLKPERKLERKPKYFVDLTLHEKINLRYLRIPFQMNYLRQNVRQKRNFDMWPLDRDDIKFCKVLTGERYQHRIELDKRSSITILWRQFGWISGNSSLRPQYFNRELTFEDIKRGYFKEVKPNKAKNKR